MKEGCKFRRASFPDPVPDSACEDTGGARAASQSRLAILRICVFRCATNGVRSTSSAVCWVPELPLLMSPERAFTREMQGLT